MQTTTAQPTYYRVRVSPSERHVAALVLGVSATSEDDAIERVRRHIETRAVNHITKLAAARVVNAQLIGYAIER